MSSESFPKPTRRPLSRRAFLEGAGALALVVPTSLGWSGGRRAGPPAGLTGVVWAWQATTAADGTVRWRPDQPDRYTLTFAPDGALAIQADCNRGRGSYAADGASISIQVGGVTRMRCAADSLMAMFLGELEYAVTFQLTPDALDLLLTEGETMRFAPAPSGTPTPG